MNNQIKPIPVSLSDKNANSLFFNQIESGNKNNAYQGFGVNIISPSSDLAEAFFAVFSSYEFHFRNVYLHETMSLHNTEISNLIPTLQESGDNDVLNIILGYQSDILKTSFDALQFCESYFNLVSVQPGAGSDRGIDQTLMELKKPWLQQLTLLATQAPLSDPDYLLKQSSEGLRQYRLGAMRDNISMVEPEIRDADIFSVDINAIRHSDATIQSRPSIVGLTAEETSQLAYYAGRAERNKVFCLLGLNDNAAEKQVGMDLLATLTWYYLYGVEHRQKTYPPGKKNMSTYVLEQAVGSYSLTFFKDESTEKWWVESPLPKHKLSKSFPLIACDYRDYSLAANEQILSGRLESIFEIYRSTPDSED